MGRSLAGPEYLETRLTDYLEAWFRELGVRCERQPVAPGRDNLLAWYDAPAARRLILFDVHQDTVPADGMTIPPFVPEITGGRLCGRGSCDVKGSMAAMLSAFARLVRERPPGSASVLLACTVDEEFTHIGSSRLAETKHGAELAIVAEPTSAQPRPLPQGCACAGRSGPGASPATARRRTWATTRSTGWAGSSTFCEKYAGMLAAFEARPDPRPAHPVGRSYRGGTERQRGPRLVRDRSRSPPDPRRRRRGRHGHGERAGGDKVFEEADCLEMSQPWVHMPPLAPQATRWIEPLSTAIETATGHRPRVMGVPFGTDAGPLSEQGTPCVVFGPGDIAQAHTKDEWIDLEQVQLAAQAYFQIAVDLGR